ncbi:MULTISPECIES: metal ABC transporter permease [unclassified Paracoccus (in: a-proteobacteria)]|uniref:metal ABC transporter permease n=1 Tax=unclassified Paracoccus (in: a-proteobacteria) TaxID=2688777 RepID=UPI0012B3C177|nr:MULTISPECIES: metal ABC transporter permease [unclassified Paracoccus (in: a-proteobacteria)]UXU74706.1 metal ABC transporter permease [Paracoccus sp. SMMA_5]UXU80602.1 metal ABC transporter permease [Paracoccus sp. SMMA_5_TC]
MIEALLLPLSFPFMRDAVLVGLMISVPAGLLSCFLVLRGWSLLGDAVSHAVLPGVVLAYIAGLPLILGAFLAGLGSALLSGWLQGNSRVKQDTVLGVVMSGMFALGVVLYTWVQTDLHLDHILFGNMLGIAPEDLRIAGVLSALIGGVVLLKWRDLALMAFDPVQARVSGLPLGLLRHGFLAMVAATVVAMLSAVGIILAVALLIAPGAIAFLLTRRLPVMMATAVAAAAVASTSGVWASFWLDSAPAPTIVLVLMIQFLLALTWRNLATRMAQTRA